MFVVTFNMSPGKFLDLSLHAGLIEFGMHSSFSGERAWDEKESQQNNL